MATRRNSLTMLLLAAAAGCAGVPATPSFTPQSYAAEGEARATDPEVPSTPLMVEEALFEVLEHEQGRGDPVVLVPADPETTRSPYATADQRLHGATDGHVWDEATGGVMEPSFDAERPLSASRYHLLPVLSQSWEGALGCNADELLGHALDMEVRLMGVRRQTRQRPVPALLIGSDFPGAATLLVFLAGRER